MNDKIKLEILSLKNDLLQKREINLNFVIIGLAMENFSSLLKLEIINYKLGIMNYHFRGVTKLVRIRIMLIK